MAVTLRITDLPPIPPQGLSGTAQFELQLEQAEETSSSRESCELRDKTWNLYEKLFKDVDIAFIKRWDDDLSNLLLFATLFSAMVTAFVLESYKLLSPSTDLTTSIVLQQLLRSNGSYADGLQALRPQLSDAEPDVMAVRVNVLWFASLVTSVSTAFLAVLTKEWLADLLDGRNDPHTGTRGRQLQVRYDNIQNWRLSQFLPFLPLLLHASFLLFFAGLINFLWYINETVAIVAAVLVCAMTAMYCWTHIRSIFNASCPYRTSLTSLILLSYDSIWAYAFWRLPAALAKLWVIIVVIKKTHDEDYELYKTAWDVMVVSWIRGKWKAFLFALRGSRTGIAPASQLGGSPPEVTAFGYGNILRFREDFYISQNTALINARALARIISILSQDEKIIQLALQELYEFHALRDYRSLFIGAGAVQHLTRQLSRLVENRDASPNQQRKMAYAHTLARLLTEADCEADDSRTVTFVIRGVPIPWDIRLQQLPWFIPYRYHPEDALDANTLALFERAESIRASGADNIVFSSHLLRLRLIRTVANPDNGADTFVNDAASFLTRLTSEPPVSRLPDDDDLISLVNTVIYVAMNMDKVTGCPRDKAAVRSPGNDRRDVEETAAHSFKKCTLDSLRALVTFFTSRPKMGHRVLRQICWGIWMLSTTTSQSLSGLLVPKVKSTDALASALADLLDLEWEKGQDWERSQAVPFSCAVLELLHHLLQRSDLPVDDPNRYRRNHESNPTTPTALDTDSPWDIIRLRDVLWKSYINFLGSQLVSAASLSASPPADSSFYEMLSGLRSHNFNPLFSWHMLASGAPRVRLEVEELTRLTRYVLHICGAAVHLNGADPASFTSEQLTEALCTTSRFLVKLPSALNVDRRRPEERDQRDASYTEDEAVKSLRIMLVQFTAWLVCVRLDRDKKLVVDTERVDANVLMAAIDDSDFHSRVSKSPDSLAEVVCTSIAVAYKSLHTTANPDPRTNPADAHTDRHRTASVSSVPVTRNLDNESLCIIRAFLTCLEGFFRENHLSRDINEKVKSRLRNQKPGQLSDITEMIASLETKVNTSRSEWGYNDWTHIDLTTIIKENEHSDALGEAVGTRGAIAKPSESPQVVTSGDTRG
ncbi:hypothetical protein DAEQUDRAFT_807880 [Daedalea quercina L-15889]|uniref:DUF6535 domain-containing protein n=1 Tax=Daedalea quercina L-15889 TaxID=1314783 RepID=A0A165U0D6_9APHY|nr:hypothetical protein DAEQUDRAFT_807880 [Daedalea quercina L-15889]